MTTTNKQPVKNRVGNFNVGGINHLALVCRDMQQTVDFYEGVLGFPLVKTIELPGDMGQHFFFDIGNGDCLAFFNFPNAPEPAPGIASPDPNTVLRSIGRARDCDWLDEPCRLRRRPG